MNDVFVTSPAITAIVGPTVVPAAALAVPDVWPVAITAAVALAAVHVFAGRLRLIDVIPRSRLLSLAGGASVAYVFVHALPELERVGGTIDRRMGAIAFVEEHVYFVALAGFVASYGLEQYVQQADDGESDGTSSGTFWLHVGSIVIYNGLVGYLLSHQETPGIGAETAYATAVGLHFLVNDYGLRHRHSGAYHRYGRWLLAGAVFVGAAHGALTTVDRLVLEVLFALLSGGVVLNVIKAELPPERESRSTAFAAGTAGYAALLLLG